MQVKHTGGAHPRCCGMWRSKPSGQQPDSALASNVLRPTFQASCSSDTVSGLPSLICQRIKSAESQHWGCRVVHQTGRAGHQEQRISAPCVLTAGAHTGARDCTSSRTPDERTSGDARGPAGVAGADQHAARAGAPGPAAGLPAAPCRGGGSHPPGKPHKGVCGSAGCGLPHLWQLQAGRFLGHSRVCAEAPGPQGCS